MSHGARPSIATPADANSLVSVRRTSIQRCTKPSLPRCPTERSPLAAVTRSTMTELLAELTTQKQGHLFPKRNLQPGRVGKRDYTPLAIPGAHPARATVISNLYWDRSEPNIA